MAKTYSRDSGSKFPEQILEMNNVKDIDDSIKETITNYYDYISQGKYTAAADLISANPELADYWIDAAKINLLGEEVYNMGIYINKKRDTVVSSTEPDIDYDVNTIWIRPIE